LRCFEDDNIVHVDGSVDPIRDKEVIDTELQLKDLETVETRMQKVSKQASIGDKDARKQLDLLERVKLGLEQGLSARAVERDDAEEPLFQEMQLLTGKPVMYVCNVEEGAVVEGNAHVEKVKSMAASEGASTLIIGAAIEADIAELEDADERAMFLSDIGLEEPGVAKLIRSAYSLLSLQTYFTAGEKEVRAWTVKEGSTAPQAAGVIHTDFEKGFIRAEVMKYADFVGLGSEQAVKEAGKLNVEGKEYIVQDGDIMHFRFNV
jgi:GTP-binding protein YchF